MASGIINLSSTDAGWKGRIQWSSTAHSSSNSSTVNFAFQVYNEQEGGAAVALPPFTYDINGAFYNEDRTELLFQFAPTTYPITVTPNVWTTISSWNKNIAHNANGKFTISFSWIVYSGNEIGQMATYNLMSGGTMVLDNINRGAYITSAPNFTDADNPTIKYVNPNGATSVKACISLTGARDDISYRSISSSGAYTFTLTPTELSTLINAVSSGNSRYVYFYIQSVVDGVTFRSNVRRKFTITDYLPSLAPVAVDMNDTTTALTGDINTLIKGYSTAACQVNALPKANATITAYKITNGSQVAEKATAALYNVESATFTFEATDSRGNKATKELVTPFIEYFAPTCNQEVEIELSGETDAKVKLSISGKWFNSTFGKVNNTLKLYVRHTQNDGTMGAWTELTNGLAPTYIGNDYSLTVTISGFKYQNAYTFQCKAADKLGTKETGEYTVKLTPVFDWSETDFNFNVPVAINGDLHINGNLTIGDENAEQAVDYIIEQGTEAMGTNGTWYWSKWKSGKAECYGMRNFGNMALSTSWGSMYRSSDFEQSLPTGLFTTIPDYINISLVRGGGAAAMVASGINDNVSASSTGSFFVYRPVSMTMQQVHLAFNVIGKWK